ncbi:IS481 family transposase [Pseudonocardia adelaidensis]|uniref:IS481 family transposase n=1 Tax=Pseudonocardia adelaidensis TaxID=648754 RepID=A0ABP9P5A4_9PSEU
METRLAMVLAGSCDAVSVTALCAELEISRQTYYRLRRRYLAEGRAGLAPRSRRPHSCPGAVDAALELEIIRLRTDEGWPDPPRGAASIADELRRAGLACPAVSTIHRVLVRNGLVTPQPQKRPRASYTRFTYPDPNGCWQIDATRWELTDGGPDGAEVWVMDVLDDHSRVVVAAHACPAPTTAAAQAAVHAAGQRWGLPARVLSDNGPCFGGVSRSGDFVEGLAALGIHAIHARPFHPQTCGKIERFHQTLKRWLRTQPRPVSLAQLQAQLDWFVEFYNHRRPHRALRGATPAQAWAARTPAGPAQEPIVVGRPARVTLSRHTVTRGGVIYLGRTSIGLGTRLAGTQITAVRYGRRLLLLDGGHPVRALTLLPGQRYYRQPSQPLLEPTRRAEQDAPRTPGAGHPPAPARQPGAAEAHRSRVARSTIAGGDARQGALEL